MHLVVHIQIYSYPHQVTPHKLKCVGWNLVLNYVHTRKSLQQIGSTHHKAFQCIICRIQIKVLTTLKIYYFCFFNFWFRRTKLFQNRKSSFGGEFMFPLQWKYRCWYCTIGIINIQNIPTEISSVVLMLFRPQCYSILIYVYKNMNSPPNDDFQILFS